MSDLISRQAVYEEIKHGKNRPKIYDGAQEVDWIMECINQVPIAYDVDRVIKRISNDKEHTIYGCINKYEAIEIIKEGVVKE